MLYWNTVSSLLKNCLLKLMEADCLTDFRLVGGTALSLQLGHRMSVDIDLFAYQMHGEIDFVLIENYLKQNFEFVSGDFGNNPGLGKSYTIGNHAHHVVKLDIYYSMEPFFQKILIEESVRMASMEEIIAMKIDVVQRGGRKKDFWDLHELMEVYNLKTMIDLHKQRYEWTHDAQIIKNNFTKFNKADQDFPVNCLRGKDWEFIKEDIVEKVKELWVDK